MYYLLLFVILLLAELSYFKLADKFNIIDKPNFRSSHTQTTIRGGGIIFPIAALLFTIVYPIDYLFFIALLFISVVSFVDDIKTISSKFRLFIQLLSIFIGFYYLNVFDLYPILTILLGLILFVGIINAYNFMDGINGITGVYSLVILFALQFINYYLPKPFINPDFIWFPILSLCIFLFFNFRKKAKCFAGDVGSVSIAFWIVIIIIKLMIETNSLIWLLLLSVYGVDTVCTICHRLYLKQNIFEAHRLHYYQILANEYKMDHRVVTLLYAVLQAVVIVVVVFFYSANISFIISLLIIVLPLLLLYLTKFILLKYIRE